MNLKERSYQKELLDDDYIPFADIMQNMQELNVINKWLGGHQITIEGFKKLAGTNKHVSVCEIGCGGGDNLVAIYRWCKIRNVTLSVIGIDIKAECIAFAKSRQDELLSVNWITSDYRKVNFETKPDIIFSSLFCHHFTSEELVSQFLWMQQNSRIGFFINDLQRNTIAYYAIKLLSSLFSKSYLVKHDGPLSVARGFRKSELVEICEQAKIKKVKIKWKWAFRYLLMLTHHG